MTTQALLARELQGDAPGTAVKAWCTLTFTGSCLLVFKYASTACHTEAHEVHAVLKLQGSQS